MKKLFGLILVSTLLLSGFIFADTNGIWHRAEDVKSGTFGGDEGGGTYIFNEKVGAKEYCDENGENCLGLNEIGGSAPPGTISAFNLAYCPSGWVLADGSSGTPDLRGVFIRGLDNGRGLDSGRTLGSYQADNFKSHAHSYTSPIDSSISNAKGIGAGIGSPYKNHAVWSKPNDDSTTLSGSTETRPKNIALIYCMKTGSNPAEEVGILSTTATKVYLTDNTKDFEVGGDIYMGGKKVATEDYVDSNSGFTTCTTKSAKLELLSSNGNNWYNNVYCDSGWTMTGGGCSPSHQDTYRYFVRSYPTGNGWSCMQQKDSLQGTVFVRCCK